MFIVLKLTFTPSGLQPIWTEGTVRYFSFVIGNFMTVAVPLTVGYAVLKHRAFDIQIVIRRGLQYLFAKQVLRVILALPLVGLVLTIIVNRYQSLTAILTSNPLLLVLIAAAGFPVHQLWKRLKRST